ncbi:MAG: potassium-transporting ATPase subunit C [Deltaproteobacteria bacterium]|nr:potassium-transporting ATPase subunit C [Deltaproteobacteria bacterium]
MKSFVIGIRLAIVTIAIVVVSYTALLLAVAGAIAPQTAQGSLLKNAEGIIVGSSLLAQKFTRPEYFWPRPSAVDYNASATGGSNKSPTSGDLTDRAAKTVAEYGATREKPLPAELAAASGGGMDPHITEAGALYQAARVAQARGAALAEVEALILKQSFASGGVFAPGRLVNVLELNLALDALKK